MELNGGSVVAMIGKDCVAIATDLRLGNQSVGIAMNFEKVSSVQLRADEWRRKDGSRIGGQLTMTRSFPSMTSCTMVCQASQRTCTPCTCLDFLPRLHLAWCSADGPGGNSCVSGSTCTG